MLDKLEMNNGMIVENVVAQMLRAAGHKLYFYSNPDMNDKNLVIGFSPRHFAL